MNVKRKQAHCLSHVIHVLSFRWIFEAWSLQNFLMVFLSQWFPTSFCFVPRILLQSEPKQHRMPESCAAARTVHKSFRYRSRKNPLVSWMFECLLSKVYLYVFFSGPRFPSGSVYAYESDIVGRLTRWSLLSASSDTLVFILVYYIPSSSGHFFIFFFRFQIYKVRNEYKNIQSAQGTQHVYS